MFFEVHSVTSFVELEGFTCYFHISQPRPKNTTNSPVIGGAHNIVVNSYTAGIYWTGNGHMVD